MTLRSSPARAPLRVGVAVAAALLMSGCVSLLPKTKPAHLYRFGATAAAPAAAPQASESVGVLRASSEFQREAAGDRLLTVNGGEVAYVAETRWAAPAVVLWDQAVTAAFDADPGRVRLTARGEPGGVSYILRLDVRNFEARYENGPKAAPVIVVRVRAAMSRGADRALVSEQIFEARAPAADNRVGAIVSAYDKAVSEVLGQVVTWTNGQARPA